MQGSFAPVGRDDILTVAIGRPEHPGRVRAAGRGVGIRQYFGPPSLRYGSRIGNFSMDELDTMREKMRREISEEVEQRVKAELGEKLKEELSQQLRVEFRQELASLGISQGNTKGQPSRTPLPVSTKGSCVAEGEDILEEDIHDVQNECRLYIEDPLRVVAFGKVYNLGPTIHHKQIDDDKVRVVVERVEEPNAPVPVPTEEVQIVGQAPNQFILWPKKLIKQVEHEVFNLHKCSLMFSLYYICFLSHVY